MLKGRCYPYFMLKYFTLLSIFFFSFNLSSQEESFTSKATLEYDMYSNFNGTQKNKGYLYFNDSIAAFKFGSVGTDGGWFESDKSKNSDLHKSIQFIDTTTLAIITFKNTNTLFALERDLFGKEDYYYAKETIPIQKWTTNNNKKSIGNILCLSATCTFRGRDYTAWYAPSIPSNNGPWKFNGLPGLILEIYDATKEVYFKVTKINIPSVSNVKLINSDLSIINIKEHLARRKQNLSELATKMQARSEGGFTMSVETKITGIELNYDDL